MGMGADKPSRGLVLFGAGIARFVNQSHTHLHSLAAQSLCGFLSLPNFPPSSISTSTGQNQSLDMSNKKKMQKRQVKIPNKYADHVMESLKKKRNGGTSDGYGSEEQDLVNGGSPTFMESGMGKDEVVQGGTGEDMNKIGKSGDLKSNESKTNADSTEKENVDDAAVGEFLNLVDAYEDYNTLSGDSQDKCITPSISERFMGVRAALITENTRLKSCGTKLGLSVLQPNELINDNCSLVDSPVNLVAIELFNLLGFQEEKVLDTSQFDLVFVHVGAHEESSISKGTEYVNALVGEIISIAKPKSQIGSRLHLSVVLSYGDTSKDDESNFLISNKNKIIQSGFVSLYPRQSYTMKGSNPRTNVRGYCPILLAQWQDAVTRKDMVETFSFQDFMENGGNLTIPADRFLHEVAFKLWKAPKYGA